MYASTSKNKYNILIPICYDFIPGYGKRSISTPLEKIFFKKKKNAKSVNSYQDRVLIAWIEPWSSSYYPTTCRLHLDLFFNEWFMFFVIFLLPDPIPFLWLSFSIYHCIMPNFLSWFNIVDPEYIYLIQTSSCVPSIVGNTGVASYDGKQNYYFY